MFYGCSSLEYLPDISKLNIKKDTDIRMMLGNCSSLKSYPNFSKWNINIPWQINKIKKNNNDINLKGEIKNDILKFIPQMEIKFNSVNDFNKNIISLLKKERNKRNIKNR